KSEFYNCLMMVMESSGETGSAPLITRYRIESSSVRNQSRQTRANVLLIEDNAVNQALATAILEELGCSVYAVTNGLKALDALSNNFYHIIFMDCQMPVMDGFETTAVIREREEKSGKHVPIVALTASAMEGDRERCLNAGMDDYISKPF